MKTTLFLIVLGIWATCTSSEQNAGSIKGRILDAKTKETIPMANVYMEVGGNKIGTTTDADGRFTIKPLSAGTYELHVSYVGYNEKTIGVSVFSGETTFMKDVYISDVILIGGKEGVVVTAERDDPRLIDPGQVNKIPIKAAELEKISGSRNVAMVLRAVSSEVQISENGKDIVFRGSRNGSSTCYIDGVKMPNLSSTIPGCAIGSVVVYSGGIPACYGDVTGGIVVIETKNYFDVRAERRIEEDKKKEMNSTTEE